MENRTVYIVGGDRLVTSMFEANGWEITPAYRDASLVCFTGGSDVTPHLYGHDRHPTTRFDMARDEREQKIFEATKDKARVGICRGGQFLNVMSGGTMWQDVDAHAIGDTHETVYLSKGKYKYTGDDEDALNYTGADEPRRIEVTSTHHQMMRPNKKTSELWGFANRAKYRDTEAPMKRRVDRAFSPDVEIVFYPATNALCFQPHPEYGVKSCEHLFFECVDRAFK